MDSYEYSVVLLDLDTGNEIAYITNSPVAVTYDTHIYRPCPSMKLSPAPLTGDFSTNEYKIEGLDNTLDVVSGLAANLPYSRVEHTLREVFFDGDGIQTGVQYLHRGFVYQCIVGTYRNTTALILQDHKYYTDTTAGIPCTEMCAAPFFGDSLVCKKTVYSETHTIASISGNVITLSGALTDTTPFLFNNGYIELGAQRIKIKYHNTGLDFQMSRIIPASWEGETVEVYAGCDRKLATCRDIHDNEARFLGLGIAMVDYNPLYETV